MITIKRGNLFQTTASVIAHGCNCQGVMGAGVAKQVKNMFPQAFMAYKDSCENNLFKTGSLQVVRCDNVYIANLGTQKFYGRDSQIKYANIEDVKTCFTRLIQWCIEHHVKSFAMPKIGCGLAGLDWDSDVHPMLKMLSDKNPSITIEVWFQKG